MPLKPHPTDPDKVVYVRREYDLSAKPLTRYPELERFAALVADAEREACAKLCEDMEEKAEGTECCKWPTPADCAYAIRARGASPTSIIYSPGELAARGLTHEDVVKLIKENT